jgi:release factor glutamine methyltransferase
MADAETVAAALTRARAVLVAADTPSPALDARLLLQAVLQVDHAGIVGRPERRLSHAEGELLAQYLARRLAHEPVSKILGVRDFFGRSFDVTADVLDPRADTETLIDLALRQNLPQPPRVLDLGSGSGALICTLLSEWPEASGVAVDLSEAALAVTARNAKALGVATRLQLVHGKWFTGVAGVFDLIISNPPYIPTAEIDGLEPDVREHDPHLALDGGEDGLSCYRAIAAGVAVHLAVAGRIIVEIGAGQAADVKAIFVAAGFAHSAEQADLGGHVRALAFAKSST